MTKKNFTIEEITAAIFDKPNDNAPYPPLLPTLHDLVKQGLPRSCAGTLMVCAAMCTKEALPIILAAHAYKSGSTPPTISIKPAENGYLGIHVTAQGDNANLLYKPEIIAELREHFINIYLTPLYHAKPEYFKKQQSGRVPSFSSKIRI